MSPYYSVQHPLREALCFLVKDAKNIPDFVSGQYKREHFPDDEWDLLVDGCGLVPDDRIYWATNNSLLDAATLIVARAVENANVEVEADD